MSCFTVNKLKEVVGGKSFLTAVKASPSPKRKAGAVKKNDSCKESSTTNTDFVYHKSPQPVSKRNQEQVFAGSPVPSIHQPGEWDLLSVNPSSLETLSHLRDENQELSHRIHQIVEERDYFENSLSKVQLEKLRLMKERDDLLDKQSGRYEERLVELHSVIAELTRQLEEKTREHIPEESDEDENSTSLASTSPHEQSKTVSDLASGTSTDIIDAQAVEAGRRLVEQYGLDHPDLALFRLTSSCHASTNSLQMLAIQEELSDAKERNIQLTARLQQRESDLSLVGKQLEEVTVEKEKLRNQVKEFQNQVALLPPCVPTSVGNKSGGRAPRGQNSPDTIETSEAKMAEKKKIKRIECGSSKQLQFQSPMKESTSFTSDDESQPKVTGLELVKNGISNKIVAEHLAKDIQDSSSMNELSHSFFDPSFFQSGFMEAKMREFEIEMERLSSRMESLKAQNEVLNLTLAEAKNNSDNLTVLIGRYESNNTAQNLAASYADHVIESLEVLNILIETEMGILLANCKASGLDDLVSTGDLEASPEELMERARSNRKDAEQTARSLLQRLESVLRPDSGLEMPYPPPPPPIDANALQWEDSSGYSQATSSASTSLDQKSMPLVPMGYGTLSLYDPERECRPEDFHLREVISELKHNRSSIRSTITKLEFSHPDNQEPEQREPRSTITAKMAAARTADLEMAVLVQELMTMREERSDLRAQAYFLERENQSLKLVINSHQEQEGILRSHIRHLESELEAQDIVRESLNELTQSDFHQLRTDMRCRITELLQSLEKVKRNSELRQHQQDEVIADLKRANAALFESLERTRKKYQNKMKRMERQILQSFIPKELMSNNCDIQSQPGSIYSSLSTETDQTSD